MECQYMTNFLPVISKVIPRVHWYSLGLTRVSVAKM